MNASDIIEIRTNDMFADYMEFAARERQCWPVYAQIHLASGYILAPNYTYLPVSCVNMWYRNLLCPAAWMRDNCHLMPLALKFEPCRE